jgi:tetratricopeptide (TPR) repeat protein/tRNA A-37 threonylcarbamoyl transferase component Bud32
MVSVLERLRAALAPGIAVEREIARGGMGLLFLGRDTVLDRQVAIKVLRPELATAAAAERFLREARHAAGLRHPNVVQVHRAGEADGLLYYIMDYITGDTLAVRLERGHLPSRDVVRLGLDVLAALGAAHRQRLIHRDVKPSNIFLTRGRALLGDFGVAYAFDTTSTALTQPGHPVGTLAYISPEQLRELPVTERTDIYAVGLVLYEAATGRRWQPVTEPAKGDWSRVPRHLREPIRRALELEPGDRWPDADGFAQALASAERRSRVKLIAGTAAAAGVAMLLLAMYVPCTFKPWPCDDTPPGRDLAIFPFTTVGMPDSSMGPRLAALTGWSLQQFQGVTLVPRQVALRAWRGSSLPPPRRVVALTGEPTRSRYGVWALVRSRDRRLEVQLRVVDEKGEPAFEGSVTGPADDPPSLGDSVARIITRAVFSRSGGRRRKDDILSPVAPEAVIQFLLGEEAFARDAWLTAERHYLRAFQLDTTFVLAAWRLGNARRWLPLRAEPPYPPGLYHLFQTNREAVPPVERHLIEAQFQPSGAPRLEEYEKALLVAGDDPYAPLLYGDELFHRGPLAGHSLDEAVRMLERAVATDSTLAPAWEHLTWALIRLGDRERAGIALSQLERWADPAESEVHLPTFLRMAYAFRFGDPAAQRDVEGALMQSAEALALAARGALSFELPAAQAALGAALAASGGSAGLRASGYIGRGVALVALGRPAEGQRLFDSAAALFPAPGEARLQAAEWRLIPSALGAVGWSEAERQRGRASLRAISGDPAFRARAAWALALDAHARGDTTEARRLREGVDFSGQNQALVHLLTAWEQATRGDWQAAVAAAEPALAFDSAGHAPDPFLRAVLHLKRGEWLERSGRAAEADRSWLWYENLDLRGWPDAEAQPAEVDWALATHARAQRARLALESGQAEAGCLQAGRVAEVWSDAEPAIVVVSRQLAAMAGSCPP